jgi:hypothetical protein
MKMVVDNIACETRYALHTSQVIKQLLGWRASENIFMSPTCIGMPHLLYLAVQDVNCLEYGQGFS